MWFIWTKMHIMLFTQSVPNLSNTCMCKDFKLWKKYVPAFPVPSHHISIQILSPVPFLKICCSQKKFEDFFLKGLWECINFNWSGKKKRVINAKPAIFNFLFWCNTWMESTSMSKQKNTYPNERRTYKHPILMHKRDILHYHTPCLNFSFC